jgi:hypothetical protein
MRFLLTESVGFFMGFLLTVSQLRRNDEAAHRECGNTHGGPDPKPRGKVMVEAAGESTLLMKKTLTAAEVENLADRLLSYGLSRTLASRPKAPADMRLASGVLRGLLSKLDKATGSMAECARLIAEIEVGA